MKDIKKVILFILFIIFLGVLLIKPAFNGINYGIDLQGGFEILYRITPLDKDATLTKKDLDNTYKAIVNRIDTIGVSEPVIAFESNDLIRIQLPGVSNEEEARDRISTTAVLSFRDTDDNLLMTSKVLGFNKASLSQNEKTLFYQVALDIKDSNTFYNVTKEIAKKPNDENKMVIWLDFDPEVDSYTKEKDSCGKNGNLKCISAPYVKEAISSGNVVIEGAFTKESAQYLVDLINSGSLPTKLTEEATPKSISASFGEATIKKTAIAGIITFIVITLILTFKYKVSGLLGSICLFIYSILVFISFNAIGGVLTLIGIAALVLGIGMAVDSIIISIERIKDELLEEKSLISAYKEGNKSSLTAIIDANITTFIAGVVLYIFGESSVRGFATMLMITIIITILTTVILYRFLLGLLIKTKVFNDREKLLLGNIKPHKNFDFVKNAKYAIITSLSILVVGFICYFVKGVNLGVDFSGGTNINITGEKLNFDEVLPVLSSYEIDSYNKYLGSKNEGYVKLNDILTDKEEIEVKTKLQSLGYETSVSEISTLVTKHLTKNAIKALIYSMLFIVLYMIIRFSFNYAISGILMLVHDVLIILSVFIIFGIEIDFILVAALLTIIGYSINDTIVIFDRIRDNRKKLYSKNRKLTKEELEKLVNLSSNETVIRNIWTSITTLVSVIALIIVNLSSIHTFNTAIFIGLIAGAISSLIIGSKLWLFLEIRSLNKKDDSDEDVQELLIKGINS